MLEEWKYFSDPSSVTRKAVRIFFTFGENFFAAPAKRRAGEKCILFDGQKQSEARWWLIFLKICKDGKEQHVSLPHSMFKLPCRTYPVSSLELVGKPPAWLFYLLIIVLTGVCGVGIEC